jgi:DNA (cytosine-5)-methyltransferase 1
MMKKEIKIFETFSGIGAQTKAFNNIISNNKLYSDYLIKNVGISEWYIDAIIAYSKIHHLKEFNDLFKKLYKTYDDIDKKYIVKEYSEKKNMCFSSNSKTVSNLSRIKEDKLKELYVANKVSKNFGSINELTGKDLPEDIDIFTYSFPCQAISLQGSQGGLEKGSDTSSSLVWQVLRVLEEAKELNKLPKVLLMENVKALFGSKFLATWNEIKAILKNYGYNTYDTVINALDKGSLQRRERVFAVSILEPYDNGTFKFNNSDIKQNDKQIKDILQKEVPERCFMNNLKKHIQNETFKLKPSGIKSLTLQEYTTFQSENILYSIDGKSPTITASGANSRIKIIDDNGELRYLIPLELWLLMGFDEADFDLNKSLSLSTLNRLAGNSISVQVLEDIFEDILNSVDF